MNQEKYPRLAKRLREPVPEGRSEQAREFVMDLAVGYEEKAWGARLSFFKNDSGNYTIKPYGIDYTDTECVEAISSKWQQQSIIGDDIDNAVRQDLIRHEESSRFSLTANGIKLAYSPKISPTIFISYKHGTCAPLAKLIATQIACKTNAKPFLDEQREVSENRDEGFEQEINRCVAMIAVLREDSLSSDSYVRTEATLALDAGKQFASLWHDCYETEEEQQDVLPNDELKVRIGKFIAIPVEGDGAAAYSHAIEKLLRELCNSNEYLSYEFKPDWLE